MVLRKEEKMAGNLGVTISVGGVNDFQKSLRTISQQLRETGSDLKAIAAEFSASDKSEQAIINTTNRYQSVLSNQKTLLKSLETEYVRLGVEFDKNKEKLAKLNAKKDEESEKLSKIKSKLGESSQEYQNQAKVVADLTKEIDKTEKSQNNTVNTMSRVKTQMNNTEVSIIKTTQGMDSLGEETEDTNKKVKNATNEGFTVLKGVLANLATNAITAAIDGIKKLGSAVVDLGKQAVSNFSSYEQIAGGVETLFGQSAKVVEKYANNAYKTAGLSANQYMETVTGFSASLLQSLGGDTQKAAEIGDMAVTDMADNANKFGTSMESIQNAYQGFAKQNYTMLDNLKLGYGGTKEEMKRLLAEAEKISGIHYDISNLNDVYSAIHVVQQELGVTGTTAEESFKTIEGAANATKSAWQNVLTAVATGADLKPLINNLVLSFSNLVNNLAPVVQNVISGLGDLANGLLTTVVPQLINTIPPLITQNLPILMDAVQNVLSALIAMLPSLVESISSLIPQIVGMLLSLLPQLITVGIQCITSLIKGITQAMPQLMGMIPQIIMDIVNALLTELPNLIKAGFDLILALAEGIVNAIPQLVDKLPQIIESLVNFFVTNLTNFIETGVDIIIALINGLIKAIPTLIMAMPKIIIAILDALIKALPKILASGGEIVEALIDGLFSMIGALGEASWDLGVKVVDTIKKMPGKLLDVGKDVVKGLWDGITGSLNWIKDKITGWVGDVFGFFKKLFGINSPSKLFRDEIGVGLAEGIGVGFEDEMKNVYDQIDEATPKSFDVDSNVNFNRDNYGPNSNQNSSYFDIVSAFKEALSGMTVEMDNENMGNFVKKTVTKAIYA